MNSHHDLLTSVVGCPTPNPVDAGGTRRRYRGNRGRPLIRKSYYRHVVEDPVGGGVDAVQEEFGDLLGKLFVM